MQSGAYQNSTWVVGVAKAGTEDGHPMFGGSIIVNPDGEIVAKAKTEEDELLIHTCNLDDTKFGKKTIFDFLDILLAGVFFIFPVSLLFKKLRFLCLPPKSSI